MKIKNSNEWRRPMGSKLNKLMKDTSVHKEHYRMYKSGKHWVFSALMSVALGMSFIGTTAKADEAGQTTTAAVSTDVVAPTAPTVAPTPAPTPNQVPTPAPGLTQEVAGDPSENYAQQLTDYKNKASEFAGSLQEYNAAQTEYTNQQTTLNQEIESVNRQIDDLKNEQASYETDKTGYDTAKEHYEQTAKEYNKTVENYNNAVTENEKSVQDLNDAYDQLNIKVDGYRDVLNQYNSAKTEFDAAAATYNSAKTDFAQANTDYQTKLAARQAAKEAYESLVSSYNGDVATYETEKARLEREIEEYNGQLSASETAIANYNDLKDRYESAKNTYDAANAALQNQTDYETKIAELKAQITDFNTQEQAFEDELATYRSDISDAKTAYNQLIKKRDEAQKNYDKAVAAARDLQAEYNAISREIDDNADEYTTAVTEYDKALAKYNLVNGGQEYTEALANYRDTVHKLEVLQATFTNLTTTQRANYDRQVDELNTQKAAYETQLATYEQSIAPFMAVKTAYETAKTAYETAGTKESGAFQAALKALQTAEIEAINTQTAQYQTKLTEYNEEKAKYEAGLRSVDEFDALTIKFQQATADYEAVRVQLTAIEVDFNNQANQLNENQYHAITDQYNNAIAAYNSVASSTEYANAKAAYDEIVSKVSSINDELTDLTTTQKSAYDKQVATIRQQIDKYNDQKAAYEDLVTQYEAAKTAFQTAKSNYETHHAALANQTEFANKLTAAQDEISTYETEKTTYDIQSADYLTKVSKAQQKYDELLGRYNGLKDDRLAAENTLKGAENAASEVDRQFSLSQAEYNRLKEQYETLNHDYQAYETVYNKAVLDKTNLTAELLRSVTAYTTLTTTRKAAVEAKLTDLDAAQQDLETASTNVDEAAYQEVQTKYQIAAQALQDAAAKYATAHTAFEIIQREISDADITGQYQALLTAYHNNEAAYNTAHQEFTDATAEYNRALNTFSDLQHRFTTLSQDKTDLETQIDQLNRRKDELKDQLADLNAKHELSASKYNVLKTEFTSVFDAYSSQLEIYEANMRAYQNALNASQHVQDIKASTVYNDALTANTNATEAVHQLSEQNSALNAAVAALNTALAGDTSSADWANSVTTAVANVQQTLTDLQTAKATVEDTIATYQGAVDSLANAYPDDHFAKNVLNTPNRSTDFDDQISTLTSTVTTELSKITEDLGNYVTAQNFVTLGNAVNTTNTVVGTALTELTQQIEGVKAEAKAGTLTDAKLAALQAAKSQYDNALSDYTAATTAFNNAVTAATNANKPALVNTSGLDDNSSDDDFTTFTSSLKKANDVVSSFNQLQTVFVEYALTARETQSLVDTWKANSTAYNNALTVAQTANNATDAKAALAATAAALLASQADVANILTDNEAAYNAYRTALETYKINLINAGLDTSHLPTLSETTINTYVGKVKDTMNTNEANIAKNIDLIDKLVQVKTTAAALQGKIAELQTIAQNQLSAKATFNDFLNQVNVSNQDFSLTVGTTDLTGKGAGYDWLMYNDAWDGDLDHDGTITAEEAAHAHGGLKEAMTAYQNANFAWLNAVLGTNESYQTTAATLDLGNGITRPYQTAVDYNNANVQGIPFAQLVAEYNAALHAYNTVAGSGHELKDAAGNVVSSYADNFTSATETFKGTVTELTNTYNEIQKYVAGFSADSANQAALLDKLHNGESTNGTTSPNRTDLTDLYSTFFSARFVSNLKQFQSSLQDISQPLKRYSWGQFFFSKHSDTSQPTLNFGDTSGSMDGANPDLAAAIIGNNEFNNYAVKNGAYIAKLVGFYVEMSENGLAEGSESTNNTANSIYILNPNNPAQDFINMINRGDFHWPAGNPQNYNIVFVYNYADGGPDHNQNAATQIDYGTKGPFSVRMTENQPAATPMTSFVDQSKLGLLTTKAIVESQVVDFLPATSDADIDQLIGTVAYGQGEDAATTTPNFEASQYQLKGGTVTVTLNNVEPPSSPDVPDEPTKPEEPKEPGKVPPVVDEPVEFSEFSEIKAPIKVKPVDAPDELGAMTSSAGVVAGSPVVDEPEKLGELSENNLTPETVPDDVPTPIDTPNSTSGSQFTIDTPTEIEPTVSITAPTDPSITEPTGANFTLNELTELGPRSTLETTTPGLPSTAGTITLPGTPSVGTEETFGELGSLSGLDPLEDTSQVYNPTSTDFPGGPLTSVSVGENEPSLPDSVTQPTRVNLTLQPVNVLIAAPTAPKGPFMPIVKGTEITPTETTRPVEPQKPVETVDPKDEQTTATTTDILPKGKVVYNLKALGLHTSANFTRGNLIKTYAKKKRINRYEFVIRGYKYSRNGALRYLVQQYNPYTNRYIKGTKGYITANPKYVVRAYYAGLGKTRQIKVINPRGVKAYTTKALVHAKKHYKKGATLKVVKVVHQKYTTRYQLANGLFVTANKKFVVTVK